MDYIIIPNTNYRIYDGSVVEIARFPGIKWITHRGYYSYEGVMSEGWYFQSIPDESVIPITEADLKDIKIISNPGEPVYPPCPPHPPCPPVPPGPIPHGKKSVSKYKSGTNYEAGQIVYLVAGEDFQVSQDYISCSLHQSASDNLAEDIKNGFLVSIRPVWIDLDPELND